jgi:hypothetical protein
LQFEADFYPYNVFGLGMEAHTPGVQEVAAGNAGNRDHD